MPTFQFLLHTTDIRVEFEGEDEGGGFPAIGFYTTRRARAATADDAFRIIMESFDCDPKIMSLIQGGHDAGLNPKTEVEEAYKIPWWGAIFPWKKPGLAFYGDDDDGADLDGSESEGEHNTANKSEQRTV